MIETRYAIEQMVVERQADLMREMGEAMGTQQATSNARVVALRARTARLVGVAALALALVLGGLLGPTGEVSAGSLGGGVSAAEGIGYVP
jgi:hypothetical protein